MTNQQTRVLTALQSVFAGTGRYLPRTTAGIQLGTGIPAASVRRTIRELIRLGYNIEKFTRYSNHYYELSKVTDNVRKPSSCL